MPVIIKPDVLDISVHNDVNDWRAVKDYGIKGIIHKASEGTGFVDKRYAERRDAVRRVGMLWGAYHFATAASAEQQARHFLKTSQWDENTLLCLDWEPYGANTMSLAGAKEFLRIVYEETGQRPVLYSGNLVKERGNGDPFLAQHRLWLAQYASRPQIPRGWDTYWMWQYSGDGWGGHGTIPGITTRGIDVNAFGGGDLVAEWAGRTQDRRPAPAPAPVIVDTPADAPAPAAAPVAVDDKAPVSLAARITTASSSAAAINELADQGSRLAGVIRSVKQWFWRLLGLSVGGGTIVGNTVAPEKGNAAVVTSWVAQHPILFSVALASVLTVGFYFAIKWIEKYLVTAYNAGRYEPKKD